MNHTNPKFIDLRFLTKLNETLRRFDKRLAAEGNAYNFLKKWNPRNVETRET